jgi:hypothetical protein
MVAFGEFGHTFGKVLGPRLIVGDFPAWDGFTPIGEEEAGNYFSLADVEAEKGHWAVDRLRLDLSGLGLATRRATHPSLGNRGRPSAHGGRSASRVIRTRPLPTAADPTSCCPRLVGQRPEQPAGKNPPPCSGGSVYKERSPQVLHRGSELHPTGLALPVSLRRTRFASWSGQHSRSAT